LALVAGLMAALWGMAQAEAERDTAAQHLAEANEITGFLTRMISSSDPSITGREVRVIDLLDGAGARLEHGLEVRPETRATLHHVLGNAYRDLGDWAAALRHGREAVRLRLEALGPDDPATLEAQANQ